MLEDGQVMNDRVGTFIPKQTAIFTIHCSAKRRKISTIVIMKELPPLLPLSVLIEFLINGPPSALKHVIYIPWHFLYIKKDKK